MKKKSFGLALLSATVLGVAFVSSCKKDAQTTEYRPVSATQVVPASPTLSGVLGTGHNVKDTILLTSAIEWHLSGLVYVDSADVLIIQKGTRIEGDLSAGSGPGGGLIVTKYGKIIADGETASTPIVFTSTNWDKTGTSAPKRGDWAGVVLLGTAPTNVPATTRVEGISDNPPADATFGGTDAAHNGGILRYVRIEYAGFALSLNNELNGLTLAGVGNQTTIDYVEVFKANDDAFEFFGGTVNASHLVAIDALDDIFDTDNGYSGTISYALGVVDSTIADQSQSNGFESDNNASGSTATPNTHAKYNNITIVGVRTQALATATLGAGRFGRAAHLRRNTEFEITNSIFLGFDNGVIFDNTAGATYSKFTSAISTASGNYVHAFTNAFGTEVSGVVTGITAPAGNTGYNNANANLDIKLANPFAHASPANYVPALAAAAGVKAVGAFPTGNTTWANTWTRFN